MNSRYWRSNSHGTHWNMKAEFSRNVFVSTGPIAGRPLTIEIWASGSSSLNSRATARAGRSWPSPMSAEMIRIWRGRDSASGSPAGITSAASRSEASASCATRQSTYLRTPSENGVRGAPAELVQGALARDDLAAEVTGARGCVDDFDVPDQLLHAHGDLLDRDVLVAGQVVDAVGGYLVETDRDTVSQVLDIHESPRLPTVTGERQRLAAERFADERRDHGGLAGAGAVRDSEPEDRVVDPVELLVGLAVELTGELGARVQVRWGGKQRVLVDVILEAVRVDPDRARVDDPRDAGAASGLEDRHRPAGVHALGVLGRGVDVVDIGNGC